MLISMLFRFHSFVLDFSILTAKLASLMSEKNISDSFNLLLEASVTDFSMVGYELKFHLPPPCSNKAVKVCPR